MVLLVRSPTEIRTKALVILTKAFVKRRIEVTKIADFFAIESLPLLVLFEVVISFINLPHASGGDKEVNQIYSK
jgi:hypothetical protein